MEKKDNDFFCQSEIDDGRRCETICSYCISAKPSAKEKHQEEKPNCSNHKKDLFGETDMKKVAEMIGDLHYETLANLFDEIADKLKCDAVNDRTGSRHRLSIFLDAAGNNLHFASSQIEGAWQISKSFMQSSK